MLSELLQLHYKHADEKYFFKVTKIFSFLKT